MNKKSAGFRIFAYTFLKPIRYDEYSPAVLDGRQLFQK